MATPYKRSWQTSCLLSKEIFQSNTKWKKVCV
nr:MAG TPA: hypothetical protein [Caudoviricetes sp.]